jgi:hypothetical protein
MKSNVATMGRNHCTYTVAGGASVRYVTTAEFFACIFISILGHENTALDDF